jgi:hypothetical protein
MTGVCPSVCLSAGSEAWLKMREIIFEIERSEQEQRQETHPVQIVDVVRNHETRKNGLLHLLIILWI